MQRTKYLDELKEQDVYTLLLYAIYKHTNNPKYSTLSELIYTLDKDNLLNLCSVFGGLEIKIPTLGELKVYTSALLVYNLINSGKSFNAAYKETGLSDKFKQQVLEIYNDLSKIIEDYAESDY